MAEQHLEMSLYITKASELVSASSQHTITDLPGSFQRHPHKWELLGKALLLTQFLFVPNSKARLGWAQLLPQTQGKGAARAPLTQVITITMATYQGRTFPSGVPCRTFSGHVPHSLLSSGSSPLTGFCFFK